MNLLHRIMEHPLTYRLWMAPTADAKLAPLLAQNDLARAGRVLDVGCGPGTNAKLFDHARYLGVDLNPRYIEYARRHHSGVFLAADVTRDPLPGEDYDFILVNSLLHHLDDAQVHHLLDILTARLSSDGCIHVLELVLPDRRSVAKGLALLDRGRYPRPIEVWRTILEQHFSRVHVEPFAIGALGVDLWSLVYFQGKRRGS